MSEPEVRVDVDQPLLPAYDGACIANIVPPLLDPGVNWPQWMPAHLEQVEQVVLLVLDGLGWNQLLDRLDRLPTLRSFMEGSVGAARAITSVAPTTTATALTSITTGTSPSVHGVTGYRMWIDGEVLNVLRWNASGRDARTSIPPEKIQTQVPFCGQRPPVVARAEFRESGFTRAHLDQVRLSGWRVQSTIVAEIAAHLDRHEPFVYAYYDGIDKVAHEYGLGAFYDRELESVDHLVADIIGCLPAGAALVITSDHGQVDVGPNLVVVDPSVMAHVRGQSGEGRFRWLHARAGQHRQLLDAARAAHGDRGWVVGVEQVIDEEWFGPDLTDAARSTLGDVALVAREAVSYVDPADSGPFELVARHGSLTPDEMLVPLLVTGG